MPITAFSKPVLATLRPEIQAALDAVAAKHGIKLQLLNISFDGGTFRATVEGKCAAAEEQAKALLKMAAESHGLDVDKVSLDGYILKGYDPKKRTKPWVLGRPNDERSWTCDTVQARMRFGRVPVPATPVTAS